MEDIQQQITNKIDQLVDKLKHYKELSKELENKLSNTNLKIEYLEKKETELNEEILINQKQIKEKNQLIDQATDKIEEVLVNIENDA
ncbi:MAG: hypothetical protein CMI90_00500 [Pelagibacteraceae bacterium]|nr:hypothetical protein [Pelagibacteraceae bacterium]|tara:strand:+ start:221 stop:481 length:261 start_codon:yes stop_codon:yes gene_type:complete